MNDEQRQPLLEAWFSDREVAPENVREGVARVMTEVPQTRQQGRWLPLPLHRPKATSTTPTTTDTIEYEPSPIPASNGHTPTVIGRTSSMLSPAKAITAGAIVFALGGVMLIAQPFQQQSGVPGATTDDRWPNPEGATMFTGRIAEGTKILEDVTDEDGLTLGGLESASWVEVSDPRLDGSITIATSATGGGLGPTGDSEVINNAYRITTDSGEWIGQPSPWFWLEDDTISHRVHVLTGHGDYEGWTALMELSGDLSWNGPIDVAGIIYEGELPVPPPFSLADGG